MFALVKLPVVNYDKETEEINVIEDYNLLKINSLPVSSTFGIFNAELILADPTEEEEQLCASKLTVVTNGNLLFSLHKPGKLLMYFILKCRYCLQCLKEIKMYKQIKMQYIRHYTILLVIV